MVFIIILYLVNANHFYFYRILVLVIPILINIVFAIFVLIYESRNNTSWTNHKRTTFIFTLLSFVDIEALSALHSGFWLHKPYFRIIFLPVSRKVTKYGFLIKLLQDITQLVLQVKSLSLLQLNLNKKKL